MGKNELSGRDIWQDLSGGKAGVAEKNFYTIMSEEFRRTDFIIRSKPRELADIYSKIVLSPETLALIYSPNETWTHGVVPDYAIDNVRTKKTLYVEVKRQDGWVENKERKAGRGNAHERSNKLFTPGLLRIMRERGKMGENVLPFWVVFQGDIARDPKRVREIHCWYEGCHEHFFLWSDPTDAKAVVKHFNDKLRGLLE
jgi:Type II restriction enzyme MunI